MNTPQQFVLPLDGSPSAANDNVYNVRIYPLKYRSRYDTPEWERTRLLALQRAHWRCENCGKRGWLDAHHIDPVAVYPELFHLLSNIRALCRPCHDIETMRQAMRYGWRYALR